MATKPSRLARFWQWARRHLKWGAVLGVVIAIVCHFLPEHYRTLCNTIASCLSP